MLFIPTPSPYRPHDPTWRQPLYLHLHPLWQGLRERLATCEGRVLDIGCGLQPYRPLLGPSVTEYVGVDRPGPLANPSVVGTAEELPFKDDAFDVVLSTQVFEHVEDPARALREAARVLRPEGRLILTVPGVWPTHEAPHDYWRFTRYGLLHLLETHQLVVDELLELGGLWSTVGQMINLELQRFFALRHAVPLVNVLCACLDRLKKRQDLVMNWLVDAHRKV